MRVLVDIVHPADVLFFKRPLDLLRQRGDEVRVLSRHKDVACQLLDAFGFEHRPVSTAGVGAVGLASELLGRDWAFVREIARFRPDVMVGFGGVAIAHAGFLRRVPSVAFYDSENATLQTRVTWPLIGHLYVPESYRGRVPEGRTTRIPGTKELSYFHPGAFAPNREIALANGLDPEGDNFFVRIVQWRANHDLGKQGWGVEGLRAVVERLEQNGKVHLSSEIDLPGDLEPRRFRGAITEVHHLIAHCRLTVGESATMSCESALLGVPAIYCGRDFPGYIRELEGESLVATLDAEQSQQLPDLIERQLERSQEKARAIRDRYVESRPDWAPKVLEALDRALSR